MGRVSVTRDDRTVFADAVKNGKMRRRLRGRSATSAAQESCAAVDVFRLNYVGPM